MRISMVISIAVTALLAGVQLSQPPKARAEGTELNGVYAYEDEDGVHGTWTIHTTCTPRCVAHVRTVPGKGFDAPFVDGRYAIVRTVPAAVICPPYFLGEVPVAGGTHPVRIYQAWDPVTLAGEVDFLETPAPCGLPNHFRETFTLTEVTPSPP